MRKSVPCKGHTMAVIKKKDRIMEKEIAGYILAGGDNRRMAGRKKALLTYQNQTFYAHIRERMPAFKNVYLSVEQAAPSEALDADLVIDQYADMGPLGGILSGLEKCGEDALLVVPCDMIPFPGDMALWMAEQYRKTGRPVIPCEKGRNLSFPGIYTKEMWPALKQMEEAKDYRIRKVWESLRIPYEKVPVEDHGWKIANINSEEDYSLLTGAKINISLEEALKILEQHITRITDTQMAGLIEAVGRRTAQDLYSPIDQPPFARSPLDGYALRGGDVKGASPENPAELNVVDEIFAGSYSPRRIGPKEAVRIMTGAPIPEGADAVIRQEDTDYGEEKVHIFKPVNPYDNYCFQGEDYKAGACLVHKGERMDAANTALAASMGYDSVAVFREPRIAIIATGDELRMPGEDLEAGQIYTSNQFLLAGRLKELGITQLTVRKVPDAPAKVAACIRELAGSHDLIITSGGVSVGKKDIMHDVAENLGCRKLFWRIRFKPGSPAMAFMYDSTCVLCLSGNPFGAGAGMELLVRPALSYLTGDAGFLAKEESAVMSEDFPKPSKMRRFLRAVLTGEEVRLSKGLASSGVLSTLKDCNCIIDIPAGSPGLKRGEEVCVRIL
jgi:molybdopterin molybdotransferase